MKYKTTAAATPNQKLVASNLSEKKFVIAAMVMTILLRS